MNGACVATPTGRVAIGALSSRRNVSNARTLIVSRRSVQSARSRTLNVFAIQADSNTRFYKVESNDSLYGIGRKYAVAWTDVRDLNMAHMAAKRNIKNPESKRAQKKLISAAEKDNWRINPGEWLLIPNPQPKTRADKKALKMTDGVNTVASLVADVAPVATAKAAMKAPAVKMPAMKIPVMTFQAPALPAVPNPFRGGGSTAVGATVAAMLVGLFLVEGLPKLATKSEKPPKAPNPSRTLADARMAAAISDIAQRRKA